MSEVADPPDRAGGDATFTPAGPLRGSLVPPPDKSISHRAAIVAAMADGRTRISNYLVAEDTLSTLTAIRTLGARVGGDVGGRAADLEIAGVGLHGPAEAEIDVGNAGTLVRLLPGWLAGCAGRRWVLDGDDSIRRRPVDRVVEPLGLMGATVECRDQRLPPISIEGRHLAAIEYVLPVASAQVKSCVLLAGLSAAGETTVVEPVPTRDHTERILDAAGAYVRIVEAGGRRAISVQRAERLGLGEIAVPGDFSSAAFALVAALLLRGSEIRIEQVGLNRTRIGLLPILARMGATIELQPAAAENGEPVGGLTARGCELTGTEVGRDEVPLAIDELPLVALAGCFADGETVVRGAEELRHKESDRIAAVVDGLRGLGAQIEALPDGFAVRGTGGLRGGRLDARGDHRMAMLGAVAGLASKEGVTVGGFDAAAVSYPGFESDLRSLAEP